MYATFVNVTYGQSPLREPLGLPVRLLPRKDNLGCSGSRFRMLYRRSLLAVSFLLCRQQHFSQGSHGRNDQSGISQSGMYTYARSLKRTHAFANLAYVAFVWLGSVRTLGYEVLNVNKSDALCITIDVYVHLKTRRFCTCIQAAAFQVRHPLQS